MLLHSNPPFVFIVVVPPRSLTPRGFLPLRIKNELNQSLINAVESGDRPDRISSTVKFFDNFMLVFRYFDSPILTLLQLDFLNLALYRHTGYTRHRALNTSSIYKTWLRHLRLALSIGNNSKCRSYDGIILPS